MNEESIIEQAMEKTEGEVETEVVAESGSVVIVEPEITQPAAPSDTGEVVTLLRSLSAQIVEMRLEIIEAQVRQNGEVVDIVKTVYDKLNQLTETLPELESNDESIAEEVAQPVKEFAKKRWL